MNRILFSIATFVAISCTVIVAAVLMSLSGLVELNATVAYALAVIVGIETARRVYRSDESRALPRPERA